MSKFYLYGVILEIPDNYPTGIYNPWLYKLDPFKIIDSSALFLSKNGKKADILLHRFIPDFSEIDASKIYNCLQDASGPHNSESNMCTNGNLILKEQSSMFEHRIYEVTNGTIWEYVRTRGDEVSLRYFISADYRNIFLLRDETNTEGVIAFEYLNRIIPSCIIRNKMLTFHAALIEDCGRGILICAPSGTGKTTHARLWRDCRGSLILNGDRAVCYADAQTGHIIACSFPWSGTSGEQICRQVPVKALVVLNQSSVNEVTRLSPFESLAPVLENTLLPRQDEALLSSALDLIDDFLGKVPVFLLNCRPEREAVEVLEKELSKI